jgi:apolipoprotein D and lipocalin family protein
MKTLFSFIITLALAGCSATHEPLPTVQKVEIEKYLGTWYEIARYEHRFEKGCSDISATYSLKENGEIDVLNQCTKNGELTVAHGRAHAVDATNAKLKVSFFWPFYGNYWVLMLGENYEYAVIGEPKREYFWILSREKSLPETLQKQILEKLPTLGYEKEKLIWVEHTK